MSRPSVLESLMAAGLDAELVRRFKDRRVKLLPCQCPSCQSRPEAEEPGHSAATEGASEPETVASRYLAMFGEEPRR